MKKLMREKMMSHSIFRHPGPGIKPAGLLLLISGMCFINLSCQDNYSLYEDLETIVTGTEVHSHNTPGYTPVPDSLRLRFQPQLRMLHCTVVSEGCDPHLEARVEATSTQLTIRFDMNNACDHDVPEYFDVDIFVSPVHPDTFALVVEQVDFASNDSASRQVLLSERVNVRLLPGF